MSERFPEIAARAKGEDAVEWRDDYITKLEAEVERLREDIARDAGKVEDWWAARAEVKIEGNSRAYYVLRARWAEAEVERLREALEYVSTESTDKTIRGYARAALTLDQGKAENEKG